MRFIPPKTGTLCRARRTAQSVPVDELAALPQNHPAAHVQAPLHADDVYVYAAPETPNMPGAHAAAV